MAAQEFEQLLQRWQHVYRDFFTALDRLPYNRRTESGICGPWNAKQVVAHMAGWHQIAQARFDAIEDGDETNRIDNYDTKTINAINAENVAIRAHLDWTQTIMELRMRMAALEERAQRLIAHGEATDPRYHAWLRGLIDDAEDHTPQIAAWAPEDA